MNFNLLTLSIIAVLAPLFGSIIAGLFGKIIGNRASHTITILGMSISFVATILITTLVFNHQHIDHVDLYDWIVSGNFHLSLGFLVDRLTVVMMLVVTFISLLVHIYSIGYMQGDEGYPRFFSYMSLFTFMMLILVMADNFTQLFFGWEGVGLVSYLLIGFWYSKEAAARGSLKAFIVNRVGDFGFILGIAALLDYTGSLNYADIFSQATTLSQTAISIFPGTSISVGTLICVLLFIGAMGKSAQIPLHIWLPESMEGPTPISALIHAATMVTAGVFMVARLSPLFILSQAASSMILIVGATGALFLALLATVEKDIKRVIAFSTMSQLGYMMVANGAAIYSAAIFHLIVHACFKALLFLGAGSIILALHHEQDLFKMGGLRKYLPITYFTFLIGALTDSGIPPLSGFYSKDAIVDAVYYSTLFGANYAYICLTIGAFVTPFYTFRAFFLAFHNEERFSDEARAYLLAHKTSATIIIPLVILAAASLAIGVLIGHDILYSGTHGILGNSVVWTAGLGSDIGCWIRAANAFYTPSFWLAISGIISAWVCYVRCPNLPTWIREKASFIYNILIKQYGFDAFNQFVFVRGGLRLSRFFYKVPERKILDSGMVEGSGYGIEKISLLLKRLQSGYLYEYALIMVVSLVALLIWQWW